MVSVFVQSFDCFQMSNNGLGPEGWGAVPYRQVLEKPRSHDVCGHFGEDASLLVVPAVSVGLVLLAGAGGGHGTVQTVA